MAFSDSPSDTGEEFRAHQNESPCIATSVSTGTMSQGSTSKTKAVAMADLVTSMKQQLDYYWSLGDASESGMNCSPICRVQQHIREVDRFSYEPFILSLGPYHRGAARLRNMEKLKWGYLDEVIRLNPQKTLVDYLLVIGGLLQEARNCYSEDVDINDEDFLKMLLLDGCFILVALGGIERFLAIKREVESKRCALEEIVVEDDSGLGKQPSIDFHSDAQSSGVNISCEGYHTDGKGANEAGQNDAQFAMWFMRFLHHDLFLLENQIPFFIVRKMYELVCGNATFAPPLSDALNKVVEEAFTFYPTSIREHNRPEDFQHLLHLCLIYLRPNPKVDNSHHQVGPQYIYKFCCFGQRYFRLGHHPEGNEQNQSAGQTSDSLQSGQELNRWRRATQYIEAGVKFMRREYDNLDPHSLLDIKFSSGTIEIPCIVVDEYSGSFFRNIIAFEQTCPQFGDDFTAYIVFLSQIISMPEDVTLLVEREIIVHHLDSDEHVSELFTMLSKDVVFDFNGNYYLKSLCQAMEEYYQNRLNRWIAWLWMNHFSNPWLALAAAGTCIVLVCTVVQTIFTILAYRKPPSHK